MCDKSDGNWELGAGGGGSAEMESEWYRACSTLVMMLLWTGTGPEMKFQLFLCKFLMAMPDLNSMS